MAFQQAILGPLFALFYCYLLYLTIDFHATGSLSITINNINHRFLLLFYCISAVILLLFHCYFLGHFRSIKYTKTTILRAKIGDLGNFICPKSVQTYRVKEIYELFKRNRNLRDMKFLFFIFSLTCLVCTPFSSSAQRAPRTPPQRPTDGIIWDANTKLNWDDFQGRPLTISKDVAVPIINLAYKYNPVGDSIIITVQAVFHKKKSWQKKKEANLYLLSHEQGHFDLYEIYARKIRKELLKHDKYKRKNAGTYIDKTVAYYTNMLMKEQDLYDNETKHSLDKTMQQEWLQKISDELSALDAYSNPVVKRPYK